MRLANALQLEETELINLKAEEQRLVQLLNSELESNMHIDNSATVSS